MINGKSFLAIIPARGGSKGLPRKNIRDLAGKPLIAWSIEAARKSRYLDQIVISSEDEEINAIARNFGGEVPFPRPVELAQDDTETLDCIFFTLEKLEKQYDYVVLLQPTSPLRTAEDIDQCIEKCVKEKAPVCVSVTEPSKSPYWMYWLNEKHEMLPIIQQDKQATLRQNLPPAYALNGAVYVAEINWLVTNKTFLTDRTIAHIMPQARSVDIDTELDLVYAELIMRRFEHEQI